MADIERMNACLQQHLRANNLYELSAVDAARVLDRADLLRDRRSRPGLPLRRLLRAGRIRESRQMTNGRWFIRRAPTQGAGAEALSTAASNTTSALTPEPRVPYTARTVLPDILRPGLAVVFVGESGGETGAREGTYYTGPGKCFWSELAVVGITDRELRPSEYARLPEFGVGLTDVFKHGSNSELRRMSPDERAAAIRAGASGLSRGMSEVRAKSESWLPDRHDALRSLRATAQGRWG